jgi:hypothetical protein
LVVCDTILVLGDDGQLYKRVNANANVLIDVLSELIISAEDEAIINIKKGKDRQ